VYVHVSCTERVDLIRKAFELYVAGYRFESLSERRFSSEANAGIVFQIRPLPLLSTSFSIYYSLNHPFAQC
jgi:hypothetical protein